MRETDRPRVAIAGTRTFTDRAFLFRTMDRLTARLVKPIIMTGAGHYWMTIDGKPCKVGADVFGEEWAHSHYHTVMRFHPDFDRHKGPEAFHIRNREMITFLCERRPCYCVVFWDGKSPGTRSVIELCKRMKVDHLKVVKVECPPIPNRTPTRRVHD